MSPFTQQLLGLLNSGPFLSFITEVSNSPLPLISDPYLRGGGIHRLETGGFLGRHVDFPRHQNTHLKRKLNLLLFLNKDWNTSWGGSLNLYSPRTLEVVRQISPEWNRMVLFETNGRTPHGVPDIVAAPNGSPRLSLALYYFVNDVPLYRRLVQRVSRRTTSFK